ncbi:hypothetical protein AX774_g7004 [Zancudomyces culisetae]|uniref:Uncharacterized protein n=1 Tax=Zancudomyces culisetae TaxID=1213189 RepID=A0A1R1PF29_ZANCU|nr:hypothetical protein AX774_g7004 [Zancudomyces culisetae]|eukprot:OMH79571.1 hypothetical protein AX774_g7004 [Zancudomyces culisetae]
MGGCNIPTLDTNVNAPVLPEWVKKENEKLDSTGIGAWVAVVSENKQVNTTTEDITTKRSSSPERSIANKKNAQPPPSDVTKDQSTKLPHFKLTQKVIKDNGTKMDRLPLKSDTKEAEGLSLPVFKKKKKPSNIRS